MSESGHQRKCSERSVHADPACSFSVLSRVRWTSKKLRGIRRGRHSWGRSFAEKLHAEAPVKGDRAKIGPGSYRLDMHAAMADDSDEVVKKVLCEMLSPRGCSDGDRRSPGQSFMWSSCVACNHVLPTDGETGAN